MTLNEKMAEVIESNIKWDSEDYAIAANECEAIAVEFGDEWLTEKPKFTKDCILLTMTNLFNTVMYASYMILWIDLKENGGYWGWCQMDGEEIDCIEVLAADKYKLITLYKQSLITNNDTIVKQPIIQDVNYPPLPGGDPDSDSY